MVFAAIGWLTPSPPSLPFAQEERLRAEIDVLTVPTSAEDRLRFLAQTPRGLALVSVPADAPAELGARLRVEALFVPLDASSRQSALGVTHRLREVKLIDVVEPGSTLSAAGLNVRRSFLTWAEQRLSRDSARLVSAICFNADADLASGQRDALARSGTLHIVSTSGLHVMLLAGFLSVALSWLPIPRPGQLALLGALVLVYIAAAGMEPPAIRAAAMILLMLPAYLLRRQADALSALCLSVLFILLWMPWTLRDVGLHLSFLTMLSLILWGPEVTARSRTLWGGFVAAWKLSCVAAVASAPLVAYQFGEVSIVAPAGNLVTALLVPALIGLSLLGWLSSQLVPVLGGWVAGLLVEPIAVAVDRWTSWLGGLPFAAVSFPAFPGWLVVLIYTALALLWRPYRRRADDHEDDEPDPVAADR